MWKKMRRKDRELTEEEIKSILRNGQYGILSTVGEDGYPYGVPVNYIYVEKDKNFVREEKENELKVMDSIYFHCTKEQGHKYENMMFCNKVSFTVVGETQVIPDKFAMRYESAILFGVVQNVIEGKKEILEKIIQKYCWDYKKEGEHYIESMSSKTGIYRIQIEYMSGKGRK